MTHIKPQHEMATAGFASLGHEFDTPNTANQPKANRSGNKVDNLD